MQEVIVMTRRFFWQVPEFVKFRAVFEDSETILGTNEKNEHRLFRKDNGTVCFDETEALHISAAPDAVSRAKAVLGNSRAKLKRAFSLKRRIRRPKPILSPPPECCLQ